MLTQYVCEHCEEPYETKAHAEHCEKLCSMGEIHLEANHENQRRCHHEWGDRNPRSKFAMMGMKYCQKGCGAIQDPFGDSMLKAFLPSIEKEVLGHTP